MTLKLVSAKMVPIDLALARRFRDMKQLKNERDLRPVRCKYHATLLHEGNFFTPEWRECHYRGEDYRGNGNHTSHLLAACMEMTKTGELDERSKWFVDKLLFSKGGAWCDGVPQELPALKEKQLSALVEKFTADDQQDLVTFFRRSDAKESARSSRDILGIYIGEHDDLDGLDKDRITRALAGVRRAALFDPEEFGFRDKKQVTMNEGNGVGVSLALPKVRQATRWIVETVPSEALYSHVAGAQVFAEIWVEYGPEAGEKVVNTIMKQIDEEEEPASSWESLLGKKHNKPTLESLIKKGRAVVKAALDQVAVNV